MHSIRNVPPAKNQNKKKTIEVHKNTEMRRHTILRGNDEQTLPENGRQVIIKKVV